MEAGKDQILCEQGKAYCSYVARSSGARRCFLAKLESIQVCLALHEDHKTKHIDSFIGPRSRCLDIVVTSAVTRNRNMWYSLCKRRDSVPDELQAAKYRMGRWCSVMAWEGLGVGRQRSPALLIFTRPCDPDTAIRFGNHIP